MARKMKESESESESVPRDPDLVCMIGPPRTASISIPSGPDGEYVQHRMESDGCYYVPAQDVARLIAQGFHRA